MGPRGLVCNQVCYCFFHTAQEITSEQHRRILGAHRRELCSGVPAGTAYPHLTKEVSAHSVAASAESPHLCSREACEDKQTTWRDPPFHSLCLCNVGADGTFITREKGYFHFTLKTEGWRSPCPLPAASAGRRPDCAPPTANYCCPRPSAPHKAPPSIQAQYGHHRSDTALESVCLGPSSPNLPKLCSCGLTQVTTLEPCGCPRSPTHHSFTHLGSDAFRSVPGQPPSPPGLPPVGSLPTLPTTALAGSGGQTLSLLPSDHSLHVATGHCVAVSAARPPLTHASPSGLSSRLTFPTRPHGPTTLVSHAVHNPPQPSRPTCHFSSVTLPPNTVPCLRRPTVSVQSPSMGLAHSRHIC